MSIGQEHVFVNSEFTQLVTTPFVIEEIDVPNVTHEYPIGWKNKTVHV